MSAFLEIGDICAEVSYQIALKDSHPVFRRINDETFEATTVEPGQPNMWNFFIEDSNFESEDLQRDMFWKLQRDHGSGNTVKNLLHVCYQLSEK